MKTYGLAIVLWISAVVGLVAMLLTESAAGDWVGLALLVVPLVVMLRFGISRAETQ